MSLTSKQIADKLADIGWEIQPKFKQRFATKEELSEILLSGYDAGGTLGWFLPLCVIETICSVDYMKGTLAHHQMDEALGVTTVNPIDLMSAKLNLQNVKDIMPMFEAYCGDWINGDTHK